MQPDLVKTWINPIASWIKTRTELESDPEGQWHLTAIAFGMLVDCFAECALGDAPKWQPQPPEIDLELSHEKDTDDPIPAKDDEVPNMQEGNVQPEAEPEDIGGGAPEVREDVSAIVGGDDEPDEAA